MKPMKNILKALFLLILTTRFCVADAQKPKDFYVSYPQADGTLYHIFPISFFQHKTDGDLTLDITCQCGKDSAVINFTYYAPQPEPLDSIQFTAGKIKLAGKAEKFFIESETVKKWVHRYSLKVPMKLLLFYFSPEVTPQACLYSGSTPKKYELKKTEWTKKAPVFRTIMKTIRIDCDK